ncbi:hypothetical protein L2719_18175 [Shewanella schlegeliana]|uniref:Carboxypeptidase regulatory-like domain-containing protein n=1 Tax=Shewanella schlegeliana TaxID=190308 RepID=A0ABS1T5F8_9GAMM|nr:hypothetical protein [Shewanella schlegeliana]MBL4915379.1 hypothetical protein [Shewanella schlegeliana]MCL1111457.1 hypothetical protein [Shewanella schlegeliana]GIU35159.1 hypothetical protein TUM4433_32210 [Shewanella schlegeliana]
MNNLLRLSVSALAVSSMLALAGCGSDSDDSPTPTPEPQPTVLTGIFSDSPVAGIGYETTDHSGVTDAKGQFSYNEGESVEFYIGATRFPSVTGQDEVTPMDLYQTDTADHMGVINTLRLLQSLDTDNDPDTGIQLAEDIHETLAGHEVDPTADNFDEQAQEALVASGFAAEDLVDADEALAHFGQSRGYQLTDLTGQWHTVFFTTPVAGTYSSDAFSYVVEEWTIDAEGNVTMEAKVKSYGELDTDTFKVNLSESGMLSFAEIENLDMGLSSNKDKIANYFTEDGEQELGLSIKLAGGQQLSDLEGQWWGTGIETPVSANFNQNEFGVWIDKLIIDDQGKADITELALGEQQASGEVETIQFAMDDMGKITIEDDDEVAVTYLSRGKDLILRHSHKETRQNMSVLLKANTSPALADLEGSWRLYNLQMPDDGSMNSDGFGYWIVELDFNADGLAVWSHVATSEDEVLTEQSMQMSLVDGLFVAEGDKWAMNQDKDIMVVVSQWAEGDSEFSAYAIAIKQVTP